MRISASAFRVTVLIWLVLVIPILLRGVSYQTHTVKAGDTLYGLSRSNGVSIDKLKELNGLSSDRLSIGQVLKIKALPDPAPVSRPKPTPQPAPVTPAPDKDVSTPGSPTTNQDPTAKDELPDEYFYTVQRKDNLYRISLSNKINIKDLLRFNGFADENVLIRPGDRLIVKDPASYKAVDDKNEPEPGTLTPELKQTAVSDTVIIEKVYVVQKKDTLYRIATEYGMTVDELKKLNNLTSNDLQIGQKLYLTPGKRPDPSALSKPTLTDEDIVSSERIRNDLIMPVKGIVMSEYGIRNGRPHKGIDIAAKTGTPVYAVLDGTVVYSGRQGAYGNVVVIEHPEFVMTVYAHNESNLVSVNDVVKKGQQIAAVGATGDATGPHVHFEYRYKGKAINPRKVLPAE